MPIVWYDARDFPVEYRALPDGPLFFSASWPDIVHAAVTVGRSGWRDVLGHGRYSTFEMVYRAFMVHANLKETSSGGLCKTTAQERLDPSEKSAITYFLGLTFAKLVAGLLLDVPWVMHLDVYAAQLRAVLVGGGGSGRRPDLVGRDTAARWHVLEAKGRSGTMRERELRSAKGQARALGQVDGAAPHLCVASITHFSEGELVVSLADPPAVGDYSFELDVSETQFMCDYYKPFVALMDDVDNVMTLAGRRIYVVKLLCADMVIGLDEETLFAVRDGGPVRGLQPLRDESQRWTLGSDGVFVELGGDWARELMTLEPAARRSG